MSEKLLNELDCFYKQKKIACITTDKPETSYIIHKDEYRLTKKMKGKRKPEFITGRWCAHKAIERLGHTYSDPILSGNDGEPIWPEFIAGSLSHSKKIYCAIVGNANDYVSIGIDVEDLDRRISERAFELIANNDERVWINNNLINDTQLSLFKLLIFSAKESLFKAVYPIVQKKFSFDTVSLILNNSITVTQQNNQCNVNVGKYELVFNKTLSDWFYEGLILNGNCFFNEHHIITTCLIDKKRPSND